MVAWPSRPCRTDGLWRSSHRHLSSFCQGVSCSGLALSGCPGLRSVPKRAGRTAAWAGQCRHPSGASPPAAWSYNACYVKLTRPGPSSRETELRAAWAPSWPAGGDQARIASFSRLRSAAAPPEHGRHARGSVSQRVPAANEKRASVAGGPSRSGTWLPFALDDRPQRRRVRASPARPSSASAPGAGMAQVRKV
jgi:hypothetical protein